MKLMKIELKVYRFNTTVVQLHKNRIAYVWTVNYTINYTIKELQEQKIIKLVAQRLTNFEIMKSLLLTLKTVRMVWHFISRTVAPIG